MLKNLFFSSTLVLFILQPALTQSWNLEKCIQVGIENNLMIKQSELILENQQLNITDARLHQLPNLNANVNYGLSIGRNIDPTTNGFVTQDILFGNYGLSSNIPIFQGRLIQNTIKYQKTFAEAVKKDYEQSINDLSLQIAAMYLNVLLTEERLESAKKNYQTVSLQLKNLEKMVEIGSRASADALELQAQTLKADQVVINAENALEQALLQLKQLLRVDTKSNLSIEKSDESAFRNQINETYTPDQLYDLALGNQAVIKAAEFRILSSRLQEKIARSGYYPSIGLFANINSRYSDAARIPTEFGIQSDTINARVSGTAIDIIYDVPYVTKSKVISFSDQFDRFLGYNFGVSANIPIFNHFSTRTSVRRAKIQTEQAKLNLESQKDNLKLKVVQAVQNVRASIKEFEAARKSFEASKLVTENTQKKFEIGTANSFELISSQNAFAAAENSLVISKYNLLFNQKILDLYAGKKIK